MTILAASLALHSCSKIAQPQVAQEVQERTPIIETVAPEPKIVCELKTEYVIDGTATEPDWSKTIHDYSSPRFDGEIGRRANQKNTKAIIRTTTKTLGAGSDLYDFLRLIAMRESSLIGSERPFDGMGVVHRLSADRESSFKSWKSQRSKLSSNPLSGNSSVWKTYGPYGMNSAYSISFFDQDADPRILGDTVAATIAQITKIHYVASKLDSEILCPAWSGKHYEQVGWNGNVWRRGIKQKDENGQIVREKVTVPRTWYTVHRGVQSGKVCPAWRGDTLEKFMRSAFARRASLVGLDPDGNVTNRMIGVVPDDPYQAWADAWSEHGVEVKIESKQMCKEDTDGREDNRIKDSKVDGSVNKQQRK